MAFDLFCPLGKGDTQPFEVSIDRFGSASGETGGGETREKDAREDRPKCRGGTQFGRLFYIMDVKRRIRAIHDPKPRSGASSQCI